MPFNKLIPLLETDPYASNVVLDLKFNGANGDNATIDSSPKNHAVTMNGSASLSNEQVKHGSTSLKLIQNLSNFVTVAASPDFSFNSDFTVEGWFYWDGIQVGNGTEFFATGGAGALDQMGVFSGTLFGYGLSTGSGAVPANAWIHIACSRVGASIRHFKNGVLTTTGSNASVVGRNGVLYVGKRIDNLNPYGGYMDSIRFTKGVGRYSANFNPETDTFLN